jgi:hypothetical protein
MDSVIRVWQIPGPVKKNKTRVLHALHYIRIGAI